jgi:hypothetical protein
MKTTLTDVILSYRDHEQHHHRLLLPLASREATMDAIRAAAVYPDNLAKASLCINEADLPDAGAWFLADNGKIYFTP